jgi:hypothetical protein
MELRDVSVTIFSKPVSQISSAGGFMMVASRVSVGM